MNKYIIQLSYKEVLSELSKMSLRKFIKKHYSYFEETVGMLSAMGINPKVLKNKVTADQLRQFEILGIKKNKTAMLCGVSVSTLKRLQVKVTDAELQKERCYLQQAIDRLRLKGYTINDISYIFCTYPEKLKKDFDLHKELPLNSCTKTDAEKKMLRKSFMSMNIIAQLFEDGDGEVIL